MKYLFIFFSINVWAESVVLTSPGVPVITLGSKGQLTVPQDDETFEAGVPIVLPPGLLAKELNVADIEKWAKRNPKTIKTYSGGIYIPVTYKQRKLYTESYRFIKAEPTLATATQSKCTGPECNPPLSTGQMPTSTKQTSDLADVAGKLPTTLPKPKTPILDGKLPALTYPHAECRQFMNEKGEYGPFGKWVMEELARPQYKKYFEKSETDKPNPNDKTFAKCEKYSELSTEQRKHFILATLMDLSARESGCVYEMSSSPDEGLNPNGSATGLFQLDHDTPVYTPTNPNVPINFRDKSTYTFRYSQELLRNQEGANRAKTGVSGTCLKPRTQLAGYNRTPYRFDTKLPVEFQSMHNPRSSVSCAVGIFMRSVASGRNPPLERFSSHFGPWNANPYNINKSKKAKFPFDRPADIGTQHPLCTGKI